MHYTIDEHYRLVINATGDEQAALQILIQAAPIRAVEQAVIRQLGLTPIDPEQNDDPTEAAMLTDGVLEWWDAAYARRSFVTALAQEGAVRLAFAHSHTHRYDFPTTLDEAQDFLRRQAFTDFPWGEYPSFTFNLTARGVAIAAAEGSEAARRFMEVLKTARLHYRLDNPSAPLADYREYADTDLEAPYVFAIVSDDPIPILDSEPDIWPPERVMAVASKLRNVEGMLFEAAITFQTETTPTDQTDPASGSSGSPRR